MGGMRANSPKRKETSRLGGQALRGEEGHIILFQKTGARAKMEEEGA